MKIENEEEMDSDAAIRARMPAFQIGGTTVQGEDLKAGGGLTGTNAAGKTMVRRSTLKTGERKPKKTKEEEKELTGDTEGISFFQCHYNKYHEGEDPPAKPPANLSAEEETYAAARRD